MTIMIVRYLSMVLIGYCKTFNMFDARTYRAISQAFGSARREILKHNNDSKNNNHTIIIIIRDEDDSKTSSRVKYVILYRYVHFIHILILYITYITTITIITIITMMTTLIIIIIIIRDGKDAAAQNTAVRYILY